MNLLTAKIKKALPALDTVRVNPGVDFICKFFDPCGSWTWYVLEGEEQEDGDWLFYGLVDGFEKEWGYFRLSELEDGTAGRPLGIGVERDIYFENEEGTKYV